MPRPSHRQHISWYVEARPRYEALCGVVAATLEALLTHASLDGATVTKRAKDVSSFTEKLKRKRYSDPKTEMTDLAGIRVVTLVERDVGRISDVIRGAFNVHDSDSHDKSIELGVDRFGYKSVHLVCDIGQTRASLPEFAAFSGMPFEIQVRTSLQHAWAEIEHDRGYKFAGELPSHIRRRFHLVAGMLELADREFSALSDELERYTEVAHRSAQEGTLDLELNSTTILELIKVLNEQRGDPLEIEAMPVDESLIQELRSFGVLDAAMLRDLLSPELFKAVAEVRTTTMGLLRDAMIYSDIDRYFSSAWKQSWHGWDLGSLAVMEKKYGKEKVRGILDGYGIEGIDSEWQVSYSPISEDNL